MAFQVREFEFDQEQEEVLWKFKLTNISTSQLDFYSQQASSRSLLHLTQDLITQLDQAIEKKHKTFDNKNRTIRKLCEKMLKELRVNIESFSKEIEEEKQVLLDYFAKKITEASVLQRLEEKCKRWILSMWVTILIWSDTLNYYRVRSFFLLSLLCQLTLGPEEFYRTTHRYLLSYIKDGKKINPDFEALNEIYVITVGDNFKELPDVNKSNNQNLVLVDINLHIADQYISENFLWDSEDISNIRIKTFVAHFLRDILIERGLDIDKEAYQEIEKDARIQIRAQILYKTLLKKYSHILLNFSSMEIPSEAKQYMIPINLKLTNEKGNSTFEDEFEWDILNESNNVEEFVTELIDDYQLNKAHKSQLCYQLRTQINEQLEWKFELLVKTFKAIHKDRQSPKLNTQTITVLKRNMAFAMDVNMPTLEDKYVINPNIYFNNSDLFSLLSRNVDILPEQYQQILMCKQTKIQQKQQTSHLSKQFANEQLKKHNEFVESNPYLASLGNSNHLHSVWRKALSK